MRPARKSSMASEIVANAMKPYYLLRSVAGSRVK
jgi:hypothetical protein